MASARRFLSKRALRTPQNGFEDLVPLMKDPRNVNLSGGVPPPSTYPMLTLQANLKDGTTVNLSQADTELAQRYPPFAWGKLRNWVHSTTQQLHNPPGDWGVSITAGSMSGVDLVFSMLLNEGDKLLIEEYSFTASIDWLVASGIECMPVHVDNNGIAPDALRAACEEARASGKPAKAVYVIPTGQNPTGTSLSEDRAREIYKIACEYDLVIIEDDAYFFLQHSTALKKDQLVDDDIDATLSGAGSFISMDTEARVVRLDTFSKVIAAGFRLGWITAPKELIKAYDGLAYFSSQQGCSLSMMLLGSMLESWGSEGFQKHVKELQRKLRQNAQSITKAAEEHLTGVATWHTPSAGMFLWVKLTQHMDPKQLLQRMQDHAVLGLHGDFCTVRHGMSKDDGSCFLRLSYVLEDPAAITEGVRRLGGLLRAGGSEA